ncbi:charged multivesicular body protein 6-A [Ischnura elegans]|uniref:charged multivesicular body protein 6-A n=1 Tax=Ischnura elegans TaxID=197161 RepID=UPI001ED898BE|nr:charged multivesicular body protein 6-A [Ischnura elegans]
MGALFGKSKKTVSRVTDQDKAVLQLKQQRDKIRQHQKKIENNLERDRELAKKLLKDGKKEKALLLLRKKKYQEQLLSKTDGLLQNLEHMVQDLEFSQVEMQVLDGLKAGNEALKKVHEILSVDEVERILEETREGVEKQREIDELLSGALTADDEEDVLNELKEITEGEEEIEKLPDVPTELPEPEEIVTEKKERKEASRKKVALEAS